MQDWLRGYRRIRQRIQGRSNACRNPSMRNGLLGRVGRSPKDLNDRSLTSFQVETIVNPYKHSTREGNYSLALCITGK